MLYQKIHKTLFKAVCALSVLTLTAVSGGCADQNQRKMEAPTLTVEAESFISNSGNISIVNENKSVVSVQTKEDDAWLSYKINIPTSGRYTIKLFARNSSAKEAVCWIEDYIDNKDGRTYDVSGKLIITGKDQKSLSFVQKDGTPMAASSHYLKLHIEKGTVIFDKLTFTLIREHQTTPVVIRSNTEGKEWKLIWSDEFNGQGLPDSTKWTFDIGNWGWGNNELQYYTTGRIENARQENGNLIMEARKNDYGYPWSSSRLTTRGKESFLYGKIEFRAKVPVGRGTWAAGWLLGDNYIDELSWPYCGEIDVMENVGYELDENSGNGKTHASVHCGAYYFKLNNQPTAIVDVENMHDGFHTYAIEWMPKAIAISIDGKKYFDYHDTTNNLSWPFDKPQNLILDLAIGGGWGGAKGIDSTLTSQKMILDYIRVYQLK